MTPRQIEIVDQIKAHSELINNLTKELHEAPAPVKKKGLSVEQTARLNAAVRKSMYR